MSLVQAVVLQPAEAFAREHAPSPAASVQAPQVPQQRSDDAGRQGHQVGANETSRHADGGVAAGHTPAPGEA
ncbi:hypothetical protein AB0D56_38120, partial [Streptomyces sp. NPDC048209]